MKICVTSNGMQAKNTVQKYQNISDSLQWYFITTNALINCINLRIQFTL